MLFRDRQIAKGGLEEHELEYPDLGMEFSVIIAHDRLGGIGKNGTIPWNIPNDLQMFRLQTSATFDPTKRNAVVMGWRTWESLGKRPLSNRLNVVITSKQAVPEEERDVLIMCCLEDALHTLVKRPDVEHVYVIGGARLYTEAITHPLCCTAYVTYIEEEFGCDVSVPPLFPPWFLESRTDHMHGSLLYSFNIYKKFRPSSQDDRITSSWVASV
jgi:dihydrofolate reductase